MPTACRARSLSSITRRPSEKSGGWRPSMLDSGAAVGTHSHAFTPPRPGPSPPLPRANRVENPSTPEQPSREADPPTPAGPRSARRLLLQAPGPLPLVQHRRMHDTNAHLVDAVMPRVPVQAVAALAAAVLVRGFSYQ